MSLSDLLRSRRRQTLAVGQTTRENRVLPAPEVLSQIPERSGAALPTRRRSVGARGFVALKPGNTLAVRFNPYTLAILDPAYEIAGAGYGSAGTKTAWNVPAADTTQWHDTLAFWDSKIVVNAAEMTMLGIAPATVPFSAVPYLIPSLTNPGEPYGNAGENATAKRVFAIGRYSVKSWAFGGTVETLTPSAPRTDNKAMTIGQRGESNAASFSARTGSTVDKAWLGQLYFTGAAWDSAGGAWQFSQAEVTMMLGPPYLSRVNSSATVDLTAATLGAAVPTSGAVNDALTLPSTPIALRADAPTLGQNGSFPTYLNPLYWVRWLWNGTEDREMAGAEVGTFTGEDRTGSASASVIQAGRTLTYTAANAKAWHTKTINTRVNAQTFTFGPTGPIYTDVILSWSGGAFAWGYPPPTTENRGGANRGVSQTTIPNSSAVKSTEEQSGSFRVETPSVVLVDLSFSQIKTSGQSATITPNANYYASQMGGQNYPQQFVGFRPYGIPTTPPPSYASVNAEFGAMQAAWAAQIVRETPYQVVFYYSSVAAITPTVTASLTWSTRDYLLYDEPNGIFIWLAGEFSGSQSAAGNGTATLTVTLWILTPHALVTKQLAAISPTGLDLLPEKAVGAGKYAIPSPQIRAIFAPLYQEQGAFKGAHYTSAAEEAAGATPVHLFNFLLSLRTYAGLGTLNADNEGNTAVAFVPCNLLEMLHGFWFSTEYGVAASGDRYPIQYATRYSDLITALFTTPFAIAVRDGTETDWTPTVNAAGAGLYRT